MFVCSGDVGVYLHVTCRDAFVARCRLTGWKLSTCGLITHIRWLKPNVDNLKDTTFTSRPWLIQKLPGGFDRRAPFNPTAPVSGLGRLLMYLHKCYNADKTTGGSLWYTCKTTRLRHKETLLVSHNKWSKSWASQRPITGTKNPHPAALTNKGTVWRGLFDFQLH